MISGIIYAIIDNEYFYIGSTRNSLEERIEKHKIASKEASKKYSKLYKYINEVRKNWDDILYIVLEKVECKTLGELEKKENFYIKPHIGDEYCLNVINNFRQKHIIKHFVKKYNK